VLCETGFLTQKFADGFKLVTFVETREARAMLSYSYCLNTLESKPGEWRGQVVFVCK